MTEEKKEIKTTVKKEAKECGWLLWRGVKAIIPFFGALIPFFLLSLIPSKTKTVTYDGDPESIDDEELKEMVEETEGEEV